MTGWRWGVVSCAFFVEFSRLLSGCQTQSDGGDCPNSEADGQCVDADEIWAALAALSIENTNDAECPTVEQLGRNYQTEPYSLDLSGDSWVSGPETGRTDGLCCYVTTYTCE
jgi:hypothetical protein